MNKIFLFAFVAFSIVSAEVDYDNAIKMYKNLPEEAEDLDSYLKWLEPYDQSYLPYEKCSEVTNLKVVKIEEKVKYYYDHKDGILDTRHYYALVSIVRITYNVTCLNKLSYEGVQYLFSDPKKIDGSIAQDDDVLKRFKAHVHDFEDKTLDCLNEKGVFYDKTREYRFNNYDVFDRSALIEYWKNLNVPYPHWVYIPGPSRLSRPVVFVHGLNDDYTTWGVEPLVDKGEKGVNKSDEKFQNGLVKSYDNGSAPDILARYLNIDNGEKNINHNGIYFFQAPGNVENGKWRDAKPHWNGANGDNSQSSKLYQRLIEVLDDFYADSNLEWRKRPELVVDIVAHSQGGLVVREMLRGLRAEGGDTSCSNPANHIRKLVTVDTPHLGAATAARSSEDIRTEYPGLGKLIDDLNDYVSGDPTRHPLMNVKIGVDYLSPMIPLISGAAAGVVGGALGFLGLAIPVVSSVPTTTASAGVAGAVVVTAAATAVSTASVFEYNVYAVGPFLGPYKIRLNMDPLGPGNFDIPYSIELDPLDDYRDMAIENRTLGDYLYSDDDFMKNLNKGKNGESYPRLPNGKRLVILPLYSGDVSMVVVEMLKQYDEALKIKCPEVSKDEQEACIALDVYLQTMTDSISRAYTRKTIDVEIDPNDTLLTILNDIRETWLTNSDLIVEVESQKYESKSLGISHKDIPELEESRSYLLHDALAPDEPVAHLSIPGAVPATRQGLDIACALDLYCDSLLAEKAGVKMIYLNNGSVGMTGDFDVAPIFLSKGVQGIRVSDGANLLEAIYEPGVGSYVNYTDKDGVLQHDIVLQADISTNPRLQRVCQSISAKFINYSGKVFSKDYTMSGINSNVTLSIIGEEGASLPAVMPGVGNVSDLNTQVAPTSSKSWETKKNVFVMHREARGDYESNTSRPRFLVANVSDKNIEGFKVAYYFTADPARNPKVVIDYPKIPVTLENLGGDQWRFVLDASDSVLNAMSVSPSLDGWQIRLYYERDWSDFNYLDDWSADYNIGVPRMNSKIVVYGTDGQILWGQEPEPFRSSDDGLIPAPKGIISWSDVAPWENNMFKPQVTVKNTGSVALKDYHAKLWFRVPDGKELYIPVDDWYTPYSRPTLRNNGENVWELDLSFNEYILYPGDSVIEGNVGVHLKDWSAFDKTVCGIALMDSDGNVVYGNIPSVSECKSYDTPSLLEPLYVWRF